MCAFFTTSDTTPTPETVSTITIVTQTSHKNKKLTNFNFIGDKKLLNASKIQKQREQHRRNQAMLVLARYKKGTIYKLETLYIGENLRNRTIHI